VNPDLFKPVNKPTVDNFGATSQPPAGTPSTQPPAKPQAQKPEPAAENVTSRLLEAKKRAQKKK
jgi:hypothetical protein